MTFLSSAKKKQCLKQIDIPYWGKKVLTFKFFRSIFFWQEEVAYGKSFLTICWISDQLLVLRASGVHGWWWYHLSFDPAAHLTWITLYLSLVRHQSSLLVINISSKQNSSKTWQNQVILKVYVTRMRDVYYKISDLNCLSYPTN